MLLDQPSAGNPRNSNDIRGPLTGTGGQAFRLRLPPPGPPATLGPKTCILLSCYPPVGVKACAYPCRQTAPASGSHPDATFCSKFGQ